VVDSPVLLVIVMRQAGPSLRRMGKRFIIGM
jgi:hypothetical protein